MQLLIVGQRDMDAQYADILEHQRNLERNNAIQSRNPKATFHYSFASVATSSATRACRKRKLWRKNGNIAPILEDMDHIDEAEEYEKGVGIIAY